MGQNDAFYIVLEHNRTESVRQILNYYLPLNMLNNHLQLAAASITNTYIMVIIKSNGIKYTISRVLLCNTILYNTWRCNTLLVATIYLKYTSMSANYQYIVIWFHK